MSNKINTRIQLKHDTEANWKKATNFIPLAGEVIIYDKDSSHNYVRYKIGDGTTKINNLPFANDYIIDELNKKADKENWVMPEIGMEVSALKFVGTNNPMYEAITFDIKIADNSLLFAELGSNQGTLDFSFSGPSINEIYPYYYIYGSEYSGEITNNVPMVDFNTPWPNGYTWAELGITSMTISDISIDNQQMVKVIEINRGVIIDELLSNTSHNPVQNKVITNELNTIKNFIGYANGKPWIGDLTKIVFLKDSIRNILFDKGAPCAINNGGFGDNEPFGMNWSNLGSVGLSNTSIYPLISYQSNFGSLTGGAVLCYDIATNNFIILAGDTTNDIAYSKGEAFNIGDEGIIIANDINIYLNISTNPAGYSNNWYLVKDYFVSNFNITSTKPQIIIQSTSPDADLYATGTIWLDTSVVSPVDAEEVEF